MSINVLSLIMMGQLVDIPISESLHMDPTWLEAVGKFWMWMGTGPRLQHLGMDIEASH